MKIYRAVNVTSLIKLMESWNGFEVRTQVLAVKNENDLNKYIHLFDCVHTNLFFFLNVSIIISGVDVVK